MWLHVLVCSSWPGVMCEFFFRGGFGSCVLCFVDDDEYDEKVTCGIQFLLWNTNVMSAWRVR
jgi:hypothetical protein